MAVLRVILLPRNVDTWHPIRKVRVGTREISATPISVDKASLGSLHLTIIYSVLNCKVFSSHPNKDNL